MDQITARIKADVMGRYSRRGGVIGISGGIDSSVTMALAAKALGTGKIAGGHAARKGFQSRQRGNGHKTG